MFPNKIWFRSAMRFGLLFYSIFASIGGTIPVLTLFIFDTTAEEVPKMLILAAILLIPLYVTCIISLFIRAKFFKKEDVTISGKGTLTQDEMVLLQAKTFIKKALRAALLIYSIMFSILGTIMLGIFIFWLIPKEDLSIAITPLSIAAIFLYGTCILAIWFRTKLPKQ
ncbi:hypothetical protein [Terribacillus saccharophilus]|uniref:DUF3278 domain-containing protein n=1 Tax=Terribacillus saccharophilus TaxID=361277 RepID=A0ABX4GZJ9_9BACI|nr:hypothetical protein [Terribacillus saccharophilus]PAD36248.1 hypothetical protein CHH56_05475 [Terribacillus saccharophilus]PAD96730.1 hypothetical protein CHH50_06835 [Terribacillus saccharophilus]PAE00306.1 hypothetical protein CHH48_07740 [Terribacillus saccharophilus]